MAGPTDLHAVAEEILAAAVASLNLIPDDDPSLYGAPERAYVNAGVPADDCCEQLVVWIDPIGELPAQRDTRRAGFRTAPTFHVQIGRCVPTATLEGTEIVPPTVEELELSAAQIHADGWALWNGLHAAVNDGTILASCDKCYFDPLVARDSLGGCGGWTMVLRVTVDGWNPELAS